MTICYSPWSMLTEGKGQLLSFFSTSGAHQATQPDCTDPRVYPFRRTIADRGHRSSIRFFNRFRSRPFDSPVLEYTEPLGLR